MAAEEPARDAAVSGPLVEAGKLPAWQVAELPKPPPFTLRNMIMVIGPGAILLGGSIGSGEWLLGPAVTAQFSAVLLWVATISIVLQAVYNMEACRYTLYTGEPIYTGFMRTKPGPGFWGVVYTLLAFLQIGWPGWAASAATAIAAMQLGRLAGPGDAGIVLFWGYVTFLVSVAIIAVGRKIERTLEIVEWFFIAWILIYLLLIGILFVQPGVWGTVITGFVSFGVIPAGVDWFLLASFAAYAGAGGVGNATLTNWIRDKGFGMGSVVGFIPALVGGQRIALSHEGKVFEVNEENLARWKEWWKYLRADQIWVWAIGCFLGMGLPALMTVQFIPPGTQIGGMAVASTQAEGIANSLGGLATTGGSVFWFLTLLVGVWILFSSQISVIDLFSRMITDIVWTGSQRVRDWRGGDVRAVYYAILAVFVIWGCIAINLAQPFVLIQIGAFSAAAIFVVLTIHTLHVNRTFLPRELQPSIWREILMVVFGVVFATFTIVGILSRVFGVTITTPTALMILLAVAVVGALWFAAATWWRPPASRTAGAPR